MSTCFNAFMVRKSTETATCLISSCYFDKRVHLGYNSVMKKLRHVGLFILMQVLWVGFLGAQGIDPRSVPAGGLRQIEGSGLQNMKKNVGSSVSGLPSTAPVSAKKSTSKSPLIKTVDVGSLTVAEMERMADELMNNAMGHMNATDLAVLASVHRVLKNQLAVVKVLQQQSELFKRLSIQNPSLSSAYHSFKNLHDKRLKEARSLFVSFDKLYSELG